MTSRCAMALFVALLATPSLGSRLLAQRTCSVQGKGVTADITTSPTSVPALGSESSWTFAGAGKLKIAHAACPISSNDPMPAAAETITSGGASDPKDFACPKDTACCITYCCGTGDCFSTFLLKNSTTVSASSKRICLSSELYTRTTTQATNASAEVGMTSWAEETTAAGTCITGLGGGSGLAEFKLCGPATLELSTGMNCDGPDETVVHDTDKSAADCTVVQKPTGGYWNSYKYTCVAGLER
mmetsp:Transcript_39882/g.90751  ORF Transcript_39882/g.90751 Transcript_39882/m.90751 type:complete len:243 (+) Transcript_39882:86-814(+)